MKLLSVLCFCYLSIWLLIYLNLLLKGQKKAIVIIYLVFYIFHAVPLLLDLVFGEVSYRSYFNGLIFSQNDIPTNIVYLLYLGFIPLVFWFVGKSRNRKSLTAIDRTIPKAYYFFLYVVVFLPLFFILFNSHQINTLFIGYGAVDTLGLEDSAVTFRTNLANLTTIGGISICIILLFRKRKNLFFTILLLFILSFYIYLNGKRYIVAELLLIVLYSIYLVRNISSKTLIFWGLFGVLGILFFSYCYQMNFRINSDIYREDPERAYENFRIDFGRDGVSKLSIYRYLHNEPILGYPGQSLLFNISWFVPRSIWAEKPWPYSVYMVAAMMDNQKISYLGWGITTSILEEMISNFGFLGFILGPLIIVLICRISDSTSNIVFRIMSLYICVMLMTVQIASFLPQFYIWILLMIIDKSPACKTTKKL